MEAGHVMDLMNVPTEILLSERNRFKVERSFAFHCDDSEWIETLDHEIELLETELNRRVGDQRGM